MSDKMSRKERRKARTNKSTKTKTTSKSKSRKGLFKKILTATAVMMLVMFVVGTIAVVAIVSNAPELDEDKLTLALIPEIYDMNDELVTTLNAAENRRMANIEDVPDVLIDAVISVEDARFYDHFGVDLRRVGGAIRANITGGFGSEGASTITQQVVRNLFLEFDKTMARKLQEQYLAIKLEQKYTKDQILEMYLNAIYFSDSRYGVVEAANYYFSKDLDELTIEDAALLAGIPQRPNAHNPLNNPEAAESRRNTVIQRMLSNDKITEEEAEAAMAISVEDQLNPSEDRETNPYQSYINQVYREVDDIEGIEASDIYTGGLKIYTNLDTDLQTHVEHVMQSEDVINFPDEMLQAGITLMETQTGEVRAIGGMREPAEGVRSWNWATDPRRQAGSSIKPILDYGPAINELQWSTYHQIVDEEYYYADGETPVRNFSRTFRGSVSMREALKDSLNVPAVKAIQEVGLENAQDFGQSLGLPIDEIYESSALGTNQVSSYQMTGAYAAFGNDGEYNEPFTVRKVEFPDGRVIDLTPESEQVMEDYTAFMISDMLKDVVESGTGTAAQISGLPIAGKTGSTNFDDEERARHNIPSSAIKDAWFVGYTTELTAGVWTGYDTPADGQIIMDNNEHQLSRDIFREVMSYAHEGRETSDFAQPDSVVEVAIERSTGQLPSGSTPDSEIITEYFVRGTEPTSVSQEFEEAQGIGNLSATYDEEAHAIHIDWSYPEDDYSFKVEVQTGGSGDYSLVDITNDTKYTFSNPEYGETYSIRVTAIADNNDDLSSDPATVSITIPKEEEEEEEIDEDNELNDNNENENEQNENEDNESNNGLDENESPNNGNNENEGTNEEPNENQTEDEPEQENAPASTESNG
ncbi:PBP1A family penicillin-binding protein [Salipaludibacillus sp. LMS25]|jgi:penicillin-binding protein 1A|uniref:penicillin-binding protein 1A n=1 Tax=Salipaludibacillus sp. LMS25 TaxID=2924031 RepID=UPI0020D10979|nr:penicillin-binding protein 1A [Salipaludibacillus sp. LMS25]UTR14671.1 PBP1A family penicillin-binding protein [Salipaludibacillus sp. LMS25]